MKKFRKITALLLVLLMLFSFAGCGELSEAASDTEKAESHISEAEEDIDSAAGQLESDIYGMVDESTDDDETAAKESSVEASEETATLDEDGSYNSKEDVALYIHLYGKLPSNYITKKEAEKLGWSGGSLENYAPGKSIGGSYFGNYEGILPEKDGRSYTECDIDTQGKSSRGAKRIVFSNDGLIYYTEDHYETFELLYGEP